MERPRLRELGVQPGVLDPGPRNAITDVDGVAVGHTTRIEGDSVRTGVTAILPHGGNVFQHKVPAAVCVGNGFGKAAGFLQVRELGTLETPVVLTNTLSVGTAVEAVVAWTLRQPGNETVRSVNAVVGETNDGFLNDIRGLHVTHQDVWNAIDRAASGDVAEGCVGAGTGTRALGWKGGIGTSSRVLPATLGGYTVGALVQSNFGGILTLDGVPVGEALGRYAFREEIEAARRKSPGIDRDPSPDGSAAAPDDRPHAPNEDGSTGPRGGSCMVVLATDAPLSPLDLERLARRALLGLARTGSFMSNGSGDFVIAFSTRNPRLATPPDSVQTRHELTGDNLNPLFLAAVESVEESVYNSLLRATTMQGRDGHVVDAIPIDRLRSLLGR